MPDLTPTRDSSAYVTWIRNMFMPRTLATPEASIKQHIESAIRYWNTHSAYKISDVYAYAPGTAMVQLDKNFKSLVQVVPTRTTTWIWNDHPLWTLMGVTVLDNVTTDLIMMSEAFRNYRVYVGTNMRWTFVKSDDPSVGGKLFIVNLPNGAESVFVVGTKRVTKDEDVKTEVILDWILQYSLALVKQTEGHVLRAADAVDIKNDGQRMMDEGVKEQESLIERLRTEALWVIYAKRM